MPEFSIIIPVYNGADHIALCLESILGQEVANIEIICVDDCGTDDSASIVQSYAVRDSRVLLLRQPENGGTARARRRGVLASTGDYLLFCDQDDSLASGALSFLHSHLLNNDDDVIYLDTELVNDGGISEEEYEATKNWLKPPSKSYRGRAVIDACFVKRSVDHSIWNKAYKGDMARNVFAKTKDERIPLGEDNYESFVLLYSAKSMACLPDRQLYCYHFGRGFTGHDTLSLTDFERVTGLHVADNLIREFLQDENAFSRYEETYSACRAHMIGYMIDKWQYALSAEDKPTGFAMMADAWALDEIRKETIFRSLDQAKSAYSCSTQEALDCFRSTNAVEDKCNKEMGGNEGHIDVPTFAALLYTLRAGLALKVARNSGLKNDLIAERDAMDIQERIRFDENVLELGHHLARIGDEMRQTPDWKIGRKIAKLLGGKR